MHPKFCTRSPPNSSTGRTKPLRILGSSPKRKTGPLRASALLLSPEEGHHAKLGEYAACLWKEKAMTDVMIVVQDREFKAHKAVLACYSPYFKEVLVKPGFNETHYLQIPSVTPKAFEILLDYMYTGELKVTCQELPEVYKAARKLGMDGALSKCIELLHVTPEHIQNMVNLYVSARKLNQLDATVRAFKIIVANFERVVMTKEFLDLETHQVVEIFSSDEIGARSEIIIFLGALKWINYKYLDREMHINSVFDCIRFGLMNMEEILACFHPPILPGIMLRPKIREALLNATCYIAARSFGQDNLFADLAPKPRKFLFQGETMILWDLTVYDAEKFYVTRRYQAATKIQACFRGYITRKHFMDEIQIANYAATVIQSAFKGYCVRKMLNFKLKNHKNGRGGKRISFRKEGINLSRSYYFSRISETQEDQPGTIYAMGAFNAAEKENGQNTIFSYDAETNQWRNVAKCLVPHHDCRLVYHNDFLYVVGGYNPLEKATAGIMLPNNNCYKLDLNTKEWTLLCPMNKSRSLHGAVTFDGFLYVIGGKDKENNVLSSIEKYDASTDSWSPFSPSLPDARMAMGVAAHESFLWIAGGITNENENISILDTVWCYDKRFGRWSKTSNLPYALAFPSLLISQKQILCLGGASKPPNVEKNELESRVEVFCYENGRWLELTQMPKPCHSVIGCVSGGNIYLLGGFSTQTMSQICEPHQYKSKVNRWERLELFPEEAAGFIVAATT